MANWIQVGQLDEIEQEGVIRFDHGGRTFAVYRSPADEVYCTDGLCTHENVHLAEEMIPAQLARLKHAFERGESELMVASFPCDFCRDGGRAVFTAGEPPINKPIKNADASVTDEPEWLLTMPAGIHRAYEYWKQHLKPGGFGFAARVISYPGGKPGDIGIFITWPKSPAEA